MAIKKSIMMRRLRAERKAQGLVAHTVWVTPKERVKLKKLAKKESSPLLITGPLA